MTSFFYPSLASYKPPHPSISFILLSTPPSTHTHSACIMSSPPSCFSFYDILGVSPSASPTTIKRAYQQAALATHPDKAPSIQQPVGPTAAMDSDTPTSR